MKMPATMTRDQVRTVDRMAADRLKIPGIVLMENAAINAAAVIREILTPRQTPAHVAIVCGGGNNAGDGYAIARHLHNAGFNVTLYPAKPIDQLTGDAATNAQICQAMNLPVQPIADTQNLNYAASQWAQVDLLVDALLGTGFHGQVREPLATIIQQINQTHDQSLHVLAVDTPSGLDCQTGQPSNATIHADTTVTFVAQKTGFEADTAKPYLGKIVVADIGVPPELVAQIAQSNR